MPITINGSGTVTGITAGGLPDAIITTDEVVDLNITPAKLSQKLTSGTSQASTSGTSIDFTSIPSWVKRITVMLNGISTSGTSANYLIQLGSGSVTTTGYTGQGGYILNTTASSNVASTSGIVFANAGIVSLLYGQCVLTLQTGNTWVGCVNASQTGTTCVMWSSGSVSLGGALDRIRITTANGTDTFDAGSINILYE
jgi:hypothetical protein